MASEPAPKISFLSIGSLGTSFFEASLEPGLEGPIDFSGADAGSTDDGPTFLAPNTATFSVVSPDPETSFEPSMAVKISIPADVPCGTPGDRDMLGGQQFTPQLSIPVGF